MSYRTLLEAKRLAADKPSVVMTLGEIREHERKGDDNMTKLIYVTGESDYSAMLFERSNITVEEAYEAARGNSGEYQYEIEGDSVYVSLREFGEVDPEFIDFITNNFIDYDQTKASDFFIVREDAQ